MNADGYAYRLSITRNYGALKVRFAVLIGKLPIHVSARLRDSGTDSAVHEGDRLLALLTEALGSADEAANVLREAMSGQSVELNLGPFVSAELRKQLGESDS
jgi:hypothetical protein